VRRGANRLMANVLLVDDRAENLLALEGILEPLGQNLLFASSGEDALRQLLHHDVAVILLDVQMPELDGFETAALIKQRERTKYVPIIFVTAISKDEEQVFRGYASGAVDYVFKPFNADVLRSKVSVFIELHEKNEQLRRQSELLKEQELAELRRESEERYRFLAEAQPDQIWTASPNGELDYINQRALDYFELSFSALVEDGWTEVVHPEDLGRMRERWERSLATGQPYENELRLRRAADGSYRWHLTRAVAMTARDGAVVKWFGSNTDIHDQKRAEEAQRFLVDAGAVLAGSLDDRSALRAVATLAVPRVADWARVDILEGGELQTVAIEHVNPHKVELALEVARRYPDRADARHGPPQVVRAGKSELVTQVDDEQLAQLVTDELHLGLLRELGLRSYMCVPLAAHGDVLGAISLFIADSERRYGTDELLLAEELARRAGIAVQSARLYRELEARAQAARVLESVVDGVFLVDGEGVVRLWNSAAETATGIARDAIVGRRLADVLPGWERVSGRAETLPLDLAGGERWVSISGVTFGDGTVFAFRDITEERALEEIRQDLVATVSHELRTPLAAIYGCALTLTRGDLELDEDLHRRLLAVVVDESIRLKSIVDDLLLASQLDAGRLATKIESCDAAALAQSVLEAAGTHLPVGVNLEFDAAAEGLPPVAADEAQLRQVLENLVDNAVKYSPDGGEVRMSVEAAGDVVRFAVADEGIGIPAAERSRIFEKFYRLDPDMTRGIGGTGLGLYIARELVRRVSGRIWVDPHDAAGSIFNVEIPVAATNEPRRTARTEAVAGS
jgi:PAS domain S-box-containing protein